jgi:hypothetical protein
MPVTKLTNYSVKMNASDARAKSAGRYLGRESGDRDGSATRREFLR